VAIAPPEGWVPYTGASNEFVLYHPPSWKMDEFQQTTVYFAGPSKLEASVTVVDLVLHRDLDDDGILDMVEHYTPLNQGRYVDSIAVVSSEMLSHPWPMAVVEFRWRNRARSVNDHHVSVYVPLGDGACAMGELGRSGKDLTEEEIETLLTMLRTIQRTPEQAVQTFVYPPDVVKPARWLKYPASGFTFKHPASWPVFEESVDTATMGIPEWGTGTVVIMRTAPSETMTDDMEELLYGLVVGTGAGATAELEILTHGQRTEPLRVAYVEALVTDRETGAKGHVLMYAIPIGERASAYGMLNRITGQFAPEEQEAFLQVLQSIKLGG
jgi:hypothetical protein